MLHCVATRVSITHNQLIVLNLTFSFYNLHDNEHISNNNSLEIHFGFGYMKIDDKNVYGFAQRGTNAINNPKQ